jgi:hypothetical protein
MRAVRLEAQHLVHLAGRLLNTGGLFAFWAGVHGPMLAKQLEGEAAKAALTLQGCLPYRIPSSDLLRHLLLWKRAE